MDRNVAGQIAAIDRERASIAAENARLQARYDILLSIPSLGAATALALLIEMPEYWARRTPSKPPVWLDWRQ